LYQFNLSFINNLKKSNKKKLTTSFKKIAVLIIAAIILTFTSCTNNGDSSALQAKVDSLQNELKKFTDEKALTDHRLLVFDTLDYDSYSKQKWDIFNHSHADNIKVYSPAVLVGANTVTGNMIYNQTINSGELYFVQHFLNV
jgi:hypothetical protein